LAIRKGETYARLGSLLASLGKSIWRRKSLKGGEHATTRGGGGASSERGMREGFPRKSLGVGTVFPKRFTLESAGFVHSFK